MSENTPNLESLTISNELFKNVKCYVSGTLDPKIEKILTSCGAQFTKFMVGQFTHVICGKNYDDTHILEASDLYSVPSVNEDWVLASVRLGRLAVMKPYSPPISSAPSPLFAKFVFSMSQLDVADRKNLFGLIIFHGGKVQKMFTNRTTHLICGSAVGVAYNKALEMGRVRITIITPDWITESVKNRTLLNPETFHPRLLIVPPKPRPAPPPQPPPAPVVLNESLANIIGLDFEESIAKTEVPITREPPPAMTPGQQHVVQQNPSEQATPVAANPVPAPQLPQNPVSTQQPNVYIQQQVRQQHGAPQAMTQQQFNQMVQAKQNSNMYTVVKQTEHPNLPMQQSGGTMIVQQQPANMEPPPQQHTMQQHQQIQPEPGTQFIGNTIIRQQNPQMQQNVRMTTGPQQQMVPQQQQFVQPMQQMHPRGPQPMVQGQQKQQILVNQSFNIQQTRIITSVPTNSQGQQIITQQLNMQQMNAQVAQQKLVQSQMAQQQQQQQLPPGMQQTQVRPAMPNQIQHRPPGGSTMIIQNQMQNQQMGQHQIGAQQMGGQQIPGQQMPGQQMPVQQMPGQQMPGQQMVAQQNPAQIQQVQQGQLPVQTQVIQGQQIIQNQQHVQPGQQILNSPQPGQQFVRATRPQFQRQLIHLDAQTHAQLQKMDPQKRQEYLQQLQAKRMMVRPQGGIAYQGQGPPQGEVVPRPGTQHILIRGQIPPGLNQQQQMAWLQQQAQTRPLLVRQASHTPGLSPITQQQGPPNQQFQVDPNATPQQQQQQIQLQIQRQQQYQRLQMQREGPKTPGTPVSPRGPGFPPEQPEQIIIQDPNALPNKTKTALANMLSSRLGNNGGVNPIQDSVPEPSAAGTLRLMTAQHNATLNQGVPPPRTPQEMMALQQQRRTLGNITNAAPPPPSPVPGGVPSVPGIPQSPNQIKSGMFSPNRVAIPRPQFYGHNPNLKLPPELFLLGCNFYIVEYDETDPDELADWKTLIQKHGGEIEGCYSVRVTHVLCRTQRHGVVMQAIRDSKRCVTAYWLSDVISKKMFQPPWQALHLPFPHTFGTQKPATKHIISLTGFEGEERERIKQMVQESGARLTTYFARQNTILICKRNDPQNPKFKRAKEWSIPVVNTIWLSDILLGNLSQMSQFEATKYQQYSLNSPFRIDYALVPHLMNAWKAPINLTQESHERVKRAINEPPPVPVKKARTVPPLEVIPDEIVSKKQPDADKIPIVLFSNVDNIGGLSRAVTILGGKLAQDPREMTILVLSRLTRTIKLMYGLCVAQYIVSSAWIVESAKVGYFLPPENFPISSAEFEQTHKCDLAQVLAAPTRRSLFEGRIFYVTPKVFPPIGDLTRWIELSGGRVEKTRQSNAKIQEMNSKVPNTYVIVSCENDLHLVAQFTKPSKHSYCNVCSTEYIMQAILQQHLNIEPHIIRTS